MSRRPQTRKIGSRAAPRRRSTRGQRLGAAALSVAAHLMIAFAVLSTQATPPRALAPAAVMVAMVPAPAPIPPAPLSDPPRSAPPKPPPPPRRAVRRTPARPDPEALRADAAPTPTQGPGLSDAQLAGAATADSGGSGGACDMTRWLQSALRKDSRVKAAIAEVERAAAGSTGRAIMVWNGEWVQSQGEDGRGLAAVREAIIWEIAFAPKACRSEPMRGLVLLSPNEAPGSLRLAVGLSDWRWSDLLHPRASDGGAQ